MKKFWKNRKKGFVMLEVMVVVMILLIYTSILFASVEIENRIAVGDMREKEAYYAALSAVRLMAEEVIANGDGWVNGMAETEMELVFEPADGSGEISIPVTVWSRRNGNQLVLYAAAETGGNGEVVSLTLMKEEAAPKSDMAVDSPWLPAFYGFGAEDEE